MPKKAPPVQGVEPPPPEKAPKAAFQMPKWVWAAVAVLAAAAAVAAAVLFMGSGLKATTMHLLRTKGAVEVSNEEGRAIAAKENLGLYGGYQVGTRDKSFAWIDLDEVKLTKLDQSSRIRINKQDRHLEIQLESGSLFFNVTRPLEDGESLRIRTSDMVVGIRGTCGWMEDGGESVRIFLLEGAVEAEAVKTGERVTVSAGEVAQVRVDESGETQIEVRPFTKEYVPPFVLEELEDDEGLRKAVRDASRVDVEDPADPAERLRAEYEQIIAGRPLFAPGVKGLWESTPGLCYGDYVDVDGDGKDELLLIHLEEVDMGEGDVAWKISPELYGEKFGHVEQYALSSPDTLSLYHSGLGDDRRVFLSRSGDQFYIHTDHQEGGVREHVYYQVGHGGVSAAEELRYDRENGEESYFTSKGEVTLEEFESVYQSYRDAVEILADAPDLSPVRDRGILPELQDQELRIEVNGRTLALETAPFASEGMLMAPLEDVLEAMGIAVYRNSDSSVILASTKGNTLLAANKYFATQEEGIEAKGSPREGYELILDGTLVEAPVVESEGRLCAPVEVLASAFGGRAGWADGTRTIRVTCEIPADKRMTDTELRTVAEFSYEDARQIAIGRNISNAEETLALARGNLAGGLYFERGRSLWAVLTPEGRYDIFSDGKVAPSTHIVTLPLDTYI